jgi:hyperosmotically inducible periplasmic protein
MRLLVIIAGLAVVLGLGVGCRSTTGESLGRNIDDTTITTEVKSKLTAEKASNLTRVSVKTVNGTVSLTGNVPTSADRTRAEEITRTVSGVQKVTNNLQTDKP